MNGLQKVARTAKKLWAKLSRSQRMGALLLTFGFLLLFMIPNDTPPPAINPAAYEPLLHVIAKGESNGNYNAYFGNSGNTSVQFTKMTVAEVMAWQENHTRQGHRSHAVGKYQFMRQTLAGLVTQLNIDPGTRFDESLQDRLAIALLERRGAIHFAQKKISREEFAANLAKEWAALPRVIGDNPSESYYAADGLNKATISVVDVLTAIEHIAA